MKYSIQQIKLNMQNQETEPDNTLIRAVARLIYLVCISVVVCILLPASVQAQSDSLNKYIDYAIAHNPDLARKHLEYSAALQKIPQVKSLPDPEITAGFLIQKMELMEGYQIGDIKFMQMFPWFGVLKNAGDEMSLMAKAKFETYLDAGQNLIFDIKRTWYELYKYTKEREINEKSLDLLNIVERLSLVKFKSPVSAGQSSGGASLPASSSAENGNVTSGGMSSMGTTGATVLNSSSARGMSGSSMNQSTGGTGLSDIYRIKIEISDASDNIETIKSQIIATKTRFNILLNRPPDAAIVIPDTLAAENFGSQNNSLSDSMLTNNPMLSMLRYEQQSFEARSKMVNAMGYPMVGIGVDYTIIGKFPNSNTAMNGKDMVMPMVSITLPVYRKKYRSMKAETELLKSAATEGIKAASNSLLIDYSEATKLYNDSKRKKDIYTEQYDLAQRTLKIMVTSYATQGVYLSDILRFREQTLGYETKKLEALTDYNTSVAWLKKLASSDIREQVKERDK